MMVRGKLKVIKGDITELKVDAIVNAANSDLSNGAGVNGAIHRAAGPKLNAACAELGSCPIGRAKLTPGFESSAKYIIHTVGPIWRGGSKGEAKLLASCYDETLRLAMENQVKTIAFPAISCGVYGYPLSQAAVIALKETSNFLDVHPEIEEVYFVCFDEGIYEAYVQALDSHHHE